MPGGLNWYDFVVAAALIYGVWSGVRNGLSGEVFRVAGLVLMVGLGLLFYDLLGRWLMARSNVAEEVANLIAFVSIAVVVYLVVLLIRLAVHRWMKKVKFTAAVENMGGGIAGAVRMAVIMAWLSVLLCLMRSPFWHQEVGVNSRFGSAVVRQFPAVEAVVEKKFPETVWRFKELKRRTEQDLGFENATNAVSKKKP